MSPALETVLAGAGAAALPPWQWARPAPSATGPRRVLHILTKAIGIGGHTRYALRWLQHDEGRVHSLALTGQTGEVPTPLAAAVAASGGHVHQLSGKLVDRATALRALAGEADAVVLYTHPFDVVPVIALSGRGRRPPVLFVNHSDHCFWVGRGTADLVACIRHHGVTLCTSRRGIASDRCVLLPVPLDAPDRQRSREAAKAELGLDPSGVVLLSVAAAYKFEPIDEIDFLDLVRPVIDAHPTAVLLVVGPRSLRWKRAGRRAGGRIRALGRQPSVARYYEACDVYLDSHPVSSVTSLLEAASLGTPAMTLCPYDGAEAVLCSEDPGLDGVDTRAATAPEYVAILAGLVEDPELRTRLGEAGAERITRAHDIGRWRAEVQSLYQRLSEVAPADPELVTSETGPGEPGPLDEALCRIQSHPVLRPGLFADVYREREHLHPRLRTLEWLNLAVDEAGRKVWPSALLGRYRREAAFVRAAGRVSV